MEAPEFTDLIRRHARLIHKIAYGYCRDATDREDVVQEIALQLWRSQHRYDERYKETTWVYRIALNVAISFYRRERRHQERHLSIDAHAITIAAASVEPDEDVKLLLRCIDALGALDKALKSTNCNHTGLAQRDSAFGSSQGRYYTLSFLRETFGVPNGRVLVRSREPCLKRV